MKNLILTLLFASLALTLAAQTGLLGLSFGDSREAVLANLAKQGFTLEKTEDNVTYLTSDEIYEIASVELKFDTEDQLGDWSISYGGSDYGDVEYDVVAQLETLHGVDYAYDDEYGEYDWNLGNSRRVWAGYDWDYEMFWVEYYTE